MVEDPTSAEPSAAGGAPLISVVMVTRDLVDQGRTETVAEAVDSLVRQTFRDFELLIQDAGSEDGTRPLLEGLAARLPDWLTTRIESAPDGGIYHAMNRAAGRARGHYLIFLNSDDALAGKEALATLARTIRDTGADYVYGATDYVLDSGRVRRLDRMSMDALFQRMPFNHNAMALNARVLHEHGGFDTAYRLASDYDLIFGLVAAGRTGRRVDAVISRYAAGGASSNRRAMAADYARIWRRRLAPFARIERWSQTDLERAFLAGHLPLKLAWELRSGTPEGTQLRRAAEHSFIKSLRRTINPFRRAG